MLTRAHEAMIAERGRRRREPGEAGLAATEEHRRGVFTRRALALGAGQLALFGFLGSRLYRLQVEEGERYGTLAEENAFPPGCSPRRAARCWTATAR